MSYGYPFPGKATLLRQFREAIQIIRAMWTEDEVHFEGKYYHVQGAINQPKGVQQPHIPLVVAGKGEQVTLKLVARYADACNFTHPSPKELAQKFALLKQYCQEIGRDDREIRRTIYVNGFIGKTDAEAETKAKAISSKLSLDQVRVRGLVGSPATLRERFHEIEQLGVQEIIIFMRDVARLEPLRLLAQSMTHQCKS